jgi:GT2 family glycosyltransferase
VNGRAGQVYAIILNYRTPELVVTAAERLCASRLDRPLELLVVDNGSADGSVECIERHVPGARVIASQVNLGFAGGNNLGIADALQRASPTLDRHNTYVLLLNSDVEVEPDTLQRCLDYLAEHPQVGVISPKLVLADGRLDRACRRLFPTPARALWKLTGLARLRPHDERFAGYNLTYLDENETTEVDAVAGAFMLVRLAAIDQAGLLDDRFFMYGEDLDWAYRIKAYGWRVVYYPRAVARHLKGGTTRRQSYRMIVVFYRAMWLFHRKHYAERSPFLLNWLVMAGVVLRCGLALLVNVFRPAARKRVA